MKDKVTGIWQSHVYLAAEDTAKLRTLAAESGDSFNSILRQGLRDHRRGRSGMRDADPRCDGRLHRRRVRPAHSGILDAEVSTETLSPWIIRIHATENWIGGFSTACGASFTVTGHP